MAGRRRLTPYIEVSGPMFEEGLPQLAKDAIWEGMKDVAEVGAEIQMGFISGAGFVATGNFLRDVDVEEHRTKANAIGWIKVYPPNQYPNPDRPTRTWMEEGRRGDRRAGGERVRMRKGVGAFRKSAQRVNAMKYDQFILPRLAKAINGD